MFVCSCCYNPKIIEDPKSVPSIIDISDSLFTYWFQVHKNYSDDSCPWINGEILQMHFGLKWISDSRHGYWCTPEGKRIINQVYALKRKV